MLWSLLPEAERLEEGPTVARRLAARLWPTQLFLETGPCPCNGNGHHRVACVCTCGGLCIAEEGKQFQGQSSRRIATSENQSQVRKNSNFFHLLRDVKVLGSLALTQYNLQSPLI